MILIRRTYTPRVIMIDSFFPRSLSIKYLQKSKVVAMIQELKKKKYLYFNLEKKIS